MLKRDTLIDASLVAARVNPPCKPRGEAADARAKPRADPEARWGHKSEKGVFGYKIHIGVDATHTIIRRVDFPAGSESDTELADNLICGDEQAVHGDQAYYTPTSIIPNCRHDRSDATG